jgi:hypothetical protein
MHHINKLSDMKNSEKFRHIKGWGIDADPRNEPTYPMKNYTGDDHNRLRYEKPSQQPVNMEVLHSNERPGITAVYGTAAAPSGLSGILRRLAFRYSESSYGHWIPLMLADRINSLEGLLSDLSRGKLPDIFRELGLRSEMKYNKKAFIGRTVVKTAVAVFILSLILSGNREKRRS